MEVEDLVKGLVKRRLMNRVWIVFAIITTLALVVFCYPSKKEITRINAVSGEVKQMTGDKWIPVEELGVILSAGDRIRTGADGYAEIILEDGTYIAMENDSEIVVDIVYVNPWQGIRTAQFDLIHGETVVNAGKKGSHYLITSPTSAISVKGGVCRVSDEEIKPLDEDCVVSIESIGVDFATVVPYGKAFEKRESGGFVKRDSLATNRDREQLSGAQLILVLDETYITTEESDIIITGKTNVGNTVRVDEMESVDVQADGSFEYTITNNPYGEFERTVMVNDQAGRKATQIITINRTKPEAMTEHRLIITSPADYTKTDKPTILIKGEVQGSVRLKVGSKPVTPQNGLFEYTVSLFTGTQLIEVHSWDEDGIILTKFIHVERTKSLEKAILNITSPKSGTSTTKNRISITGTANTRNVYCNACILKKMTTSNGTFTLEASLDYGENLLTITAMDESHKESKVDLKIFRLKETTVTEPPSIHLDDYDAISNRSRHTITGIAENTINLECNNEKAHLDADGKFKFTIDLKEGNNHFELVARSASGESTTKSFEMVRDTQGPNLDKLKATRDPTTGKVSIMGILEVVERIEINGIDVTGETVTTNPESGTSSILYTLEGNYSSNYVKVTAVDIAGNISNKELVIESD